jgi:hypothetical protein
MSAINFSSIPLPQKHHRQTPVLPTLFSELDSQLQRALKIDHFLTSKKNNTQYPSIISKKTKSSIGTNEEKDHGHRKSLVSQN